MVRIIGQLWCVLFLLTGSVSAQEGGNQTDDETVYGPPEAEAPAERIIYLPYEQLSDVLNQQGSSVIIPYPEYLRLWSKAEQGDRAHGESVSAVITRADYVAAVEQDVARIQAELTIQVVGKPWVEVPVNFGAAAVGTITSETGEVLLRGTGEGRYALLLKEQGEQRVRLELTTRIVTSPDGREISFATPPVALTTLELVIPQEDQEVEVRPRLVQLPLEDASGQTRVKASLGATGNITAKWHARASRQPQMDLLASVTNLQKVSIADGLVHSDAYLEYRILRGELEQLRIAVPTGRRILDVSSSTRIQKWQTSEEEGRQLVTIDLLAPATGTLTVEVHTEERLEETAFAVAGVDESGDARGIHALDVVRESGQLVVASGEDLTLRVTDQSGLARIESEEVAEKIRQDGALAYKFFSPQFSLVVAARPIEPRVTVDQRARIEIREDQLLSDTGLNYVIERAGLFELPLALPDGLEITQVESEQMEEFRIEEDRLIVVLRQRMTGPVSLTVRAEQELPEDGTPFDLPLLEPQDVQRERGTVQLFAREAVEVATNEDELEAALPDALGTASGGSGAMELRASWRFTRRPVRIPVTVTRKPTRLSAQVASDIDVQPTRSRVTTNVDFLVEYAGLDTFRIDVPEAALPTLQIEPVASEPTSPALREMTAADPVDGYAAHTLVMQRPVTGRQRFRVTYDLQPAEPVEETEDEAGPGGGNEDGAGRDAAGDDADAASENGTDTDSTKTDSSASDAPPDDAADSDDAGADQPTTPGAAADEPADISEADIQRLQTSINLVRPRGLEASEDREATGLTRVTGEVRLTNEESLTITAAAEGADIEPIDVRELRFLPPQGTLAFRYRRHEAEETISVEVTQARYGVQEMIATVVSRALVDVVLGDDPTATYRCRYRIKSTERQRLEVRLPAGMELLSAFVNETEVRLEPNPAATGLGADRNSYFVNVSRSGESDQPFQLTIQFLLSFNEPPFDAGFLTGLRGRVTIPLPQIGGNDGTTATQQLRTSIWVPREYALIGDPSGFVLEGTTNPLVALMGGPKRQFPRHDDDGWVGHHSAQGIDFPTDGRTAYRYTNLGGQGLIKLLWWQTVYVTFVASAALAVIAWVLLRTDWENKLGILLLIAFGAMLLSIKNMHVLAHALSAMRFGLAFMVGLWVIHGLFGGRDAAPSASTASASPGGVISGTPPQAAAVPPPGVFEHFLNPQSDSDEK